MSKVTLSTEFRKVDVDELDEEKYQDEPEGGDDSDSIASREAEVKKFISGGKNFEALKAALADPPLQTKDEKAKKRNFDIVLDVLTRFKQSDVEEAVNKLNSDQVDVLMKYIYRGFAEPTENSCGILLVWHQFAVASGGVGSIVRVLTSRQTV
ncbi:PREDICTED: actin-related protein 2/3 complex subunit 5-like [Amphimedon queenslandica]|uniref:Actin-related protein 2/3 complex subunit 5 n=1 Tax=Amphimedon queenslandica TaxID=400682 RepID=I1FPV8_AMPQE|nr:PREDICTED: actin-related protein 2/3 complex subunit 5-like [Amphimedon queenslandica]XP_003388936.1 PREDICTED: actin-related protein 2/3 complex subunit 5-like [Amphimedon queenslandica]|eukprot:XP_003387054.1 PREDICTED: actin-related protein 2/3 complex subunit 5-like [Amphimedon queenslandica]